MSCIFRTNGSACALNSKYVLLRAVLVTCINLVHVMVQAEPITIELTATIDGPYTYNSNHVPFDPPFDFQEGDIITGRIRFEPVDASAEGWRTFKVETLGAHFQIGDQQMFTSDFSIEVLNDASADDGPDEPYDEIRLQCGPYNGNNPKCSPNTLPGAENVLWSFSVGVSGPTSVLDGPDIPSDPAAWNALANWRSLWMSFRPRTGAGMSVLTATIGSFVVVPEPTTLSIALIGIGGAALIRRGGQASHYPK
jgi:hypothetical protein